MLLPQLRQQPLKVRVRVMSARLISERRKKDGLLFLPMATALPVEIIAQGLSYTTRVPVHASQSDIACQLVERCARLIQIRFAGWKSLPCAATGAVRLRVS